MRELYRVGGLPQTQTVFKLAASCMACGRESGWFMCDLCAKLEAAEAQAARRALNLTTLGDEVA